VRELVVGEVDLPQGGVVHEGLGIEVGELVVADVQGVQVGVLAVSHIGEIVALVGAKSVVSQME